MTSLTLWAGTVAQGSFVERLDAAVYCGYSGMSVPLTDLVDIAPDRFRDRARNAGVALVALESMVNWLPDWSMRPGAAIDPARRAIMADLAGFDVDRTLDLAAALGCAAISVIEPFGEPVPIELGAEAFGDLCDRAAGRGLVMQLEAMPFSGIPDLPTAVAIMDMADRCNAGLMLDAWHLFRSGGNAALVDVIPLQNMSVQLSDAPRVPEPDLWTEALERRLLPGDGAMDLVGVLAALRRRGFEGPIGPEVISGQIRLLEPRVAAGRAAAACRRLFAG
jgi:sugar phosphate isomerase/epimerase